MPPSASHRGSEPSCKICTIHLEKLCYARAWWFYAFREVLASGIRLFAIALWIRTDEDHPRSKMCRRCLRFRKNALKRHSPLFNWLDSYLNPLFNRVRNSLLTPDELECARILASRAANPRFVKPSVMSFADLEGGSHET
jgi:hypothetical protein